MNFKPIVSVQLAAAFFLLCQDGSQSQTLYVDHLSPQRSVRVDPTSAQPANAMLEGRYAVEVSTDLHHWEPLVDFPAFDWFRFAAPVAADRAGPQQFYRLSETPTPDEVPHTLRE